MNLMHFGIRLQHVEKVKRCEYSPDALYQLNYGHYIWTVHWPAVAWFLRRSLSLFLHDPTANEVFIFLSQLLWLSH